MLQALIIPAHAELEPIKVMSLNYDNSSSLIYLTTQDANIIERVPQTLKYVRLTNPNRIYFDIENAVLIGEKQQLIFEKSDLKEIRLAQFETEPQKIVRTVITFEEDFDTSKIKLIPINGNIIVKISKPELRNDYFNVIYNENNIDSTYSNIVVNSQFVQKVKIPDASPTDTPNDIMGDIQRAFESSTLPNTDGKSYDSIISVDLSSNLKLYFFNSFKLA